jgi:hypothetical protein
MLGASALGASSVARNWTICSAYRTRKLEKRVEAAPLREKMPTSDGALTYVKVRPTTGDTLPQNLVDELQSYVAGLSRKEIHRKLKVEYRDGQWRKAGVGEH